MRRPLTLLALSLLSSCALGCSSLPDSMFSAESSQQEGMMVPGSSAASQYEAVAKARANNAIVLHVIGAEEPSRILPLPEDGRAVFISDLLRQSGLTEEFKRMQATLYRSSPDTLGGIRMGIRFYEGSNQVVPEHDYSLRPGDRLEVVELELDPLEAFNNLITPSYGRKFMIGF